MPSADALPTAPTQSAGKSLLMATPSSFALQILAYVTLGSAIRWMFTAGRDQQPKVFGNMRLYSVKWQVRLVCLASTIVFATILVGFRHEWLAGPDRWWASVFVVAMLMAVVTAIGSVRTDETSITMKGFWRTRSFRWAEITEVRFNQKNGQIKLRAGPQKLSIDFRFGVNTILNEVIQRTGLPARR